MLLPDRPGQSNHNATFTFNVAGKQMLCLINQKGINGGRSFCKGFFQVSVKVCPVSCHMTRCVTVVTPLAGLAGPIQMPQAGGCCPCTPLVTG